MYLGIDVGGTKTLVASLDAHGSIRDSFRFPTPKDYITFRRVLAKNVADLSSDFSSGCIGLPGRINRSTGNLIACGNLPWKNISIKTDIQKIAHCPMVVENDANLAGLSEAMLIKHIDNILYITISTGIGMSLITKREINPTFANTEGGQILLEHHGKIQKWEDFASGKAIHNRFGLSANEIQNPDTWKIIAKDIAIGVNDLIAIIQPSAIILGGGVSNNFDKFIGFLEADLRDLSTPLTPLPQIYKAQRPDEAVLYGCYDLAKTIYG